MKVSDLAKELGITSKEIVEKAKQMGIEAKAAQSNLTDIDATAIKNNILAKKKKDAETKIVKVKSKKNESGVEEKSKVTVKAAKISDTPEVKTKKAKPAAGTGTAKESVITKKAPAGKPVPKAGSKAPAGKPVPKKAAVVKRAEEEEAAKKTEAAEALKKEETSKETAKEAAKETKKETAKKEADKKIAVSK